MKSRTVKWFENKITAVLFKNSTFTTDFALSTQVLQNNSTIEDHYHYEIAVEILISRKIIQRIKTKNNYSTYSLAA